jgi:hypothetical protein
VSLALEQRTLRRIRALEDEGVRPFAWWPRVSVPAMALGAALAAVVLVRVVTTEDAGAPRGPAVTPRPQVAAETPRAAGPAKPSVAVAGSKRSPRAVASVPKDPPPELAAAPELFVDLPMLRHLEKLEHFDAILATGLDDAPANGDGGQDRSNG